MTPPKQLVEGSIILPVLYAYPVCLASAIMISNLIHHLQKPSSCVAQPRRSTYRLIWYLQALVCITLIASATLAIIARVHSQSSSFKPQTVQAQIASYIGVLLFFGAGLLPDPDGPFEPASYNFHTWVLAGLFEAIILSATIAATSEILQPTKVSICQVTISGTRVLVLLLMALIFRAPRVLGSQRSNAGEREALLGYEPTTSKHNGYRTTGESLKEAQATGWTDYFVGFSRLFPYIWPSDSPNLQVITVICFLLMIAQRIINVLVPLQLGRLVDALGHNRIPGKEIGLYCLYRGLQGQQGVIGSIRAILWIPISQSLYRRLTCAALEHVLTLSLKFHLSKRVGEVMSALNKGATLNTFLDGFAFQLFPMVFDLGIAAIYLFVSFDAFYSIITLGVMWSYVFATIYMAKYRGRVRRKQATRDRDMDAAKTDAIMAYETVHYNCALPNEMSKFSGLVQSFQRAEFAVLLSLNSLNAVQNLIFMVGVVLVSVLSAYQISKGYLKVADFVTLITYLAQLHAPLAFFGSFFNMCQNNLVDAERMLDLFTNTADVKDNLEATSLEACEGDISFEDVYFAYDDRKPAIKGITFTVKSGTKTAIVGESGGGKSTILKLLFRFYNIDSGNIKIDNRNVERLTIQSIRGYIGVVPQDTVLFNDTIKYNLLYASPEATDDEVYEACIAASIHNRILSFSEGYNTMVGERGLKLSGGEKQRVAIARALLKRPRIMLLDEATASLDSKTEHQIQEALKNVTRGRTTITVAHRLSTVTQSDQILVLHDGMITERGTHPELLELRGHYWEIWKRQTIAEKAEGTLKF